VNQMSILEMDNRMITAQKLQSYLPQNANISRLPALVPNLGNTENAESYSDRELLYKILFDMRKEVTELKKLVMSILQNGASADSQILKTHEHLFHNVEPEIPASFSSSNTNYEASPSSYLLTPPVTATTKEFESTPHAFETEEPIEDISHKVEEENLSLQDKEKELIMKALKKHNNKRKSAAEDLGISQRTLYRKIKQYGISE